MSNDLFVCRKFVPITRYEKCNCSLVSLLPFFEYNNPETWSDLVSLVANSDIPTLKKHLDNCKKMRIADRHGNGALHLSVIFKKTDVFDFLLTLENININSLNRYGQTTMHLAVITESEYFLTQLIKKGGDVNVTDESCCTPLHVASTRYCPKICEILLENGANINFQNLLGKTALYHACQYGTVDNIYMLLYYGAAAYITDVYGVLPFTAAMQQSMNSGDISQSHLECHQVLFNHTFEKNKMSVNLRTLTVAMKINSPLFPQMLKKVDHVKYTKLDLTDLSRSAIYIAPDYFKLFLLRFGYIVREMLETPQDLHHTFDSAENVNVSVVKLMDFLSMLFQIRPTFNFVKRSTNFTYFINYLVSLHKNRALSMAQMEQMMLFLFSHGLPCELVHIVVIYENCGFCDILKFLLDLDVTVTFDKPKAVMPYLIYDINLTIDKFIDLVRRPCKEYRSALKFFSTAKVRNFFGTSSSARRKVEHLPQIPSLVEMARDVTRGHIIDTFKITRSRDFYRLLNRMPINEAYKKILTYERELYRM